MSVAPSRCDHAQLPWASHAFDVVDGAGASIAREATLRFLQARLGHRAAS
jgi:hypothetical protein